MSELPAGRIGAVIHLGAISKSSTGPTRVVGQQCYMEGMSGVIYITKEVAAQWLPVLETITNNETSN